MISSYKGNLPAKAVTLSTTLLIVIQGQLILGVVHHLPRNDDYQDLIFHQNYYLIIVITISVKLLVLSSP